MGTSVSNRSPDTARWRAVQAAYAQGLPDTRVVIELARAAEGWHSALQSDAVSKFVDAVAEAFSTFGDRLLESERPDQAVRSISDAARQAALRTSGELTAVSIAERALQRTLIATSRGDRPFIDSTSREAADAWTANRGPTAFSLVDRFCRELVTQFGRHVIARDTAALVGHERLPRAADAAAYADRISRHFGDLAHRAALEHPGQAHRELWRSAVDYAFTPADHTNIDD